MFKFVVALIATIVVCGIIWQINFYNSCNDKGGQVFYDVYRRPVCLVNPPSK